MKNLIFVILIVLIQQTSLGAHNCDSRKIENSFSRKGIRSLFNNQVQKKVGRSKLKSLNFIESNVYLPDTITVYNASSYVEEMMKVIAAREVNSYDSNGNLLTKLLEENTNNTWNQVVRWKITTNSNRVIVAALGEIWTDNTWKNFGRGTSTLDINGNPIISMFESWINNMWVNESRDTYTYDTSGLVLTDIYEYWNNNSWENYFKETYTYDTNRNLLSDLYQRWYIDTWGDGYLTEYSYDSNGNVMIPGIYTYDINGILLSSVDNTGTGGYKRTYNYDKQGNVVAGEFFVWDSITNSWGHSETEPFQYKLNNRLTWTNYAGSSLKIHWIELGATPLLSTSTNAFTIAAPANSTKTFDITSNIGWTAVSDQSWLTLSNATGTGNSTITVTSIANPTTTQRTATITISGTGVTSQTITVTQDGAAQVLSASSSALTIAAPANSTKTFDITSNIIWTAVSDQSWLALSKGSGTGNATITLTAALNPTTSTRNATITISGTGVSSQTITVTQDGAAQVLSASSSALTIAAPANSTKTFDITSNIGWTAVSDQSWLTLSSGAGTGNMTITLTASANPTIASRESKITLAGVGIADQIITVTQDGGTTGIIDLRSTENVIYPNPTSNILFFNSKVYSVQIYIFDLTGRMIVNKQVVNNQIDVSNLSNGIYTIRIVDNSGVVIRKFVKK